MTINLLWSFSSVTVALLAIVWLSVKPTLFQLSGTILALLGAGLYFYPAAIPMRQIIGVIVALAGILLQAVSIIFGRELNRSRSYHPLVVTVISMGAGSIVLLAAGLCTEGFPVLDLKGWVIIAWLALVNTAFAFTLMNHTLRTLTAMESSIINSTMLIWIPIFAFVFLGEKMNGRKVIGLVVAGVGTLIVQLRSLRRARKVAA